MIELKESVVKKNQTGIWLIFHEMYKLSLPKSYLKRRKSLNLTKNSGADSMNITVRESLCQK